MREQYQSACIRVNQFFCFTERDPTCSLVHMGKYGERVRAARSFAKLTQPQLSEKLDGKISQQGISYLESSDAYGSEFTVQIADICKVNPTWLATGKGEMIVDPAETYDPKTQAVVRAMLTMPEYKKDMIVQASTSLAEPAEQKNNGTQ